ncbi:hypothetical protein R1sor_013859 [Riccia sorocarpa]|uniref:Uncharacterized protein n=1 Tax=Riccia sorocarpa TaxID=122646 RepID=A0ABD3HAZ3_9MARC
MKHMAEPLEEGSRGSQPASIEGPRESVQTVRFGADTGIQASSQYLHQNEGIIIPTDPLGQKELLEALNANKEGTRSTHLESPNPRKLKRNPHQSVNVRQLSTQGQVTHSTASVRQQQTPSSSTQAGNTDEVVRSKLRNSDGGGQHQPPKTYAQATDPAGSTPPVDNADPPIRSSQKNRKYVRDAMIQMPQPEIRADQMKIKKKILNKDVERVRKKKLQSLDNKSCQENKALVLFTGNSTQMPDTVCLAYSRYSI